MKRAAAWAVVVAACIATAYFIVRPSFAAGCTSPQWTACITACEDPTAIPQNCVLTGTQCLGADPETGLLQCQCYLECECGGMAGWNDPDHTAGPRSMQVVLDPGQW